MIFELTVKTNSRSELVDLTGQLHAVIRESGVKEGLCHVYVPHTTAGIIINENADPDVAKDIIKTLDKLVPWKDKYAHAEGNSAAHVKSCLAGVSKTIPVSGGGSLMLGTWQGVYFAEFDGPRTRKVVVSVLST
jgi:secondary thiamine-phosphate synthase enzyme